MTENLRKCETCSAWSQMMAHANAGRIEAVCLNPRSPRHSKFTSESFYCAAWTDDPAMSDMPGGHGR